MTLFSRIKRLIKADAFAFVEGLEEPRWILAQAIRDMEVQLNQDRAQLNQQKKIHEQLKKRLADEQKFAKEHEADIELAIQEKRDDLARGLIRKKMIADKILRRFEDDEKVISEDLLRLESRYQERSKAYEDIVQRRECMHWESDAENEPFDHALHLVGSTANIDQEVEIEFLRRLKVRKEGVCEK